MKKNITKVTLIIFTVLGLVSTGCQPSATPTSAVAAEFDSNQAYTYAESLMDFGPRIPGSQTIQDTAAYIKAELEKYNWQVEFQEFSYKGTPLTNILAYRDSSQPDVLIGAHYDTRQYSDQESDPALQALPVPGADDGTSGTAVLLELARSYANQGKNTWLVFFDGEDQGHINDWDWSVGAQYFADNLKVQPKKVVVIDMIGDSSLNIYREKQSDKALCDQIWETADQLGFSANFINDEKYSMIDDHLPFLKLGIPSCLLIDFDYPYWHTQGDTLDHISAQSLGAVGQVLLSWLEN